MKNKWYRKSLVKGLLIIFMHVMAVLLVISMLWILACPGAAEGALENREIEFEESKALEDLICRDSWNIIRGLQAEKELEAEGAFDENRIVDIEAFCNDGTMEKQGADGEDEQSRLAYTLGDLRKWQQAYTEGNIRDSYSAEPGDEIIVCRKPDKSYEYYYYSDFKRRVEEGELLFVTEDDVTQQSILEDMRQGAFYEGNTSAYTVMDKEGNVRYTNCWNYDGYWLEEACKPAGSRSVLEIANQNPEWNGRLEEAYQMLGKALDKLSHNFSAYETLTDNYEEGNTNLTYLLADKTEKKIYTNSSGYEQYDTWKESIESLKRAGKYIIVMPKLADFESNIEGISADMYGHGLFGENEDKDAYVFAVALDTTYPVQDTYYQMKEHYQYFSGKSGLMIGLSGCSAAAILAGLVWLTVIAGRRPEDEEIHCNLFDRCKTEIAAVLVIGIWILCMLAPAEGMRNPGYYMNGEVPYGYASVVAWSGETIAAGTAAALITCGLFLAGYLSLVRRIKAKTVWKNSFLRWFIVCIRQGLRHIPTVWKSVALFFLFLFNQAVLFRSGVFLWVLLSIMIDAAAFYYVVRQAVGRKKVKEALTRIAEGDVEYQIDLEGLKGDQLVIAEQLNRIGEGLEAAVEANVKNERMKTDLITNVSHDIKTPLTSIINYVDLLKRENIQDAKVQDYLNILEAKAQRLKVLTEDVVEASKVSSGNIVLECMNLNLVEMVQQTSGEFAERFETRGLKEVLRLPEEPAVVWADGRRMWRVLENLYGNAAKYAMKGSRIYADLSQSEDEVAFSLKNISEQPLNISADELTERFIRGDISRSTEGSGLGLSIARNLVSLMGGEFELYLDGDLFRVTLTFPRVKDGN